MAKFQIHFKDPDLIWDLINAKHPLPDDYDEITQKLEKQRKAYSDEFFEYGDHGCVEIDSETLACSLLPRKEWGRK